MRKKTLRYGLHSLALLLCLLPVTGGPSAEGKGGRGLKDCLTQLNQDIKTPGLHDYPASKEKLITGYAYGEYFDYPLPEFRGIVPRSRKNYQK